MGWWWGRYQSGGTEAKANPQEAGPGREGRGPLGWKIEMYWSQSWSEERTASRIEADIQVRGIPVRADE